MEKGIEKLLNEHRGDHRDSLIPILQEVQETEGYLSQQSIEMIARALKLPSSKIYGVATFYNQFRFEPKGKFHIQVCRGTACHVLGSATVLDTLEQTLKVKAGQTTRDKIFSIEVVACIGACGLAPVICVNGAFHAKVTEKSMVQIIEDYKKSVEENGNENES